ncbi:MAG: Coenzyme F420 hydrogenase/dehydrogenase, beta subunit C-terminal domain [Oscillospiraceae bacterium]|nr:Coenzyme F420 hydrogenase/dehydrogenase, beta subunit C-terminal domain [Oscillospiraceae bacterium]
MKKIIRKLKKRIQPWVPKPVLEWLKRQMKSRKPSPASKPQPKPRLSPALHTPAQLDGTCAVAPPKKLKIGILSINVHTAELNFACPLHSLVFSNTLTALGYDNVVVDYYPIYAKKNADQQYPLLSAVKSKDSEDKQSKIKLWTDLFYQRKERFAKFDAFIKKHYTFTKQEYDAATLDAMPSAEDINCYIVATDTVWRNYAKGFDRGFFLACRAMKDAYKIAYSVSRGPAKYTKAEEKQFINYIKDINEISVREQSLHEYISSISDVKSQVVLDPVFLGKREFYESILVQPKQKGYVLLYLMQEADDFLALAANFAKQRGMELIELSRFYKHPQKTGYAKHRVIYDAGVEEWLGYIKHADYVFTNSFHGSCFSIILEKQFFFNGKRGGDKVKLLFKTFGLEWRNEDQAFDKQDNLLVDNIDYAPVNAKREQMVEQSMAFLKTALANAEVHLNQNRDFLTSGDKSHCSGCTACANVCPHQAIAMQRDDEGFSFPHIDPAKCTRCMHCVRTCPRNTKQELYTQPKQVYLAYNNDPDDRRNASSGGVFMAMAKHVLAQGGAVVGVKFNAQYEAMYDIAHTVEDCHAFRFSKYVEAADNDVYPKTKAALQSGRPVLFTGTPCKVSGLLNYLGKPYDNLYCADFLCHGTNSPLMLRGYLHDKQQKNGPLAHFQFRTPREPQGPVTIELAYENGKREIGTRQDNLYLKSFLSNVMLKRSCYACEYCLDNGISDITFGDFWGGAKYYTGADRPKGISCMKVNTAKGAELFSHLDVYQQEQTVEQMYAKNHKRPAPFPAVRNKIFGWVNHDGLTTIEAMQRATGETFE